MPPSRPPFPRNPYRLFHLSARLRLSPSHSQTTSQDDYYTLILSNLHPAPAKEAAAPSPNPTQPSSAPASSIQTSSKGPDNKVSFGRVLSGPSARMRGVARAERGLERPQEPDNCCMSGCVNCVWDSYREEVEEWAAARRRRRKGDASFVGGGGVETGVGDLDEGYRGVEVSEEGIFEGLPVGIREFMSTEKRLREKRGMEGGGA